MQQLIEDLSTKDFNWFNASSTTQLPRHRWYYYKEGFSPEFVKKAIAESKCKPEDLIIDPFNGSGTVTLTAAEEGFLSKGYEVNPFSVFVSKTKMIKINNKDIIAKKKKILNNIAKGAYSSLLGFSTFSKKKELNKWLFNDEILNSFEGGLLKCSQWDHDVANIFKLALIGAAMDNCNAVRDGKCLRYRTNWKKHKYNNESFIFSFLSRMKNIEEDLEQSFLGTTCDIICGDSRKLLDSQNPLKYKLCITSPPYLNSNLVVSRYHQ